jgi:hypothetical protein
MNNNLYFPVMWLVIAALVTGIFAVTAAIAYYRKMVAADAAWSAQCKRQLFFLGKLRWMLWAVALALTAGGGAAWYRDYKAAEQAVAEKRAGLTPVYDKAKVWEAPDLFLAETDDEANLIAYGRDLIAHTQDYFGENGLVRPGSINGLNCQSCHLNAGSKPFGNNYFAVQSTYPQMRARSGMQETIPKRVDDCFQRSLDGAPLEKCAPYSPTSAGWEPGCRRAKNRRAPGWWKCLSSTAPPTPPAGKKCTPKNARPAMAPTARACPCPKAPAITRRSGATKVTTRAPACFGSRVLPAM